ncbi:Zinc finger protein [Pseudolycoriella hygida]|uniref:Zinc finger protein n=1 Tax=Pseudolycoriella hygida TaxID=35572 RepID=A0A9Q0S8B8_9DIPT|nr:Zinc finger protein [Pseudolycoriella hygida]
MQSTRIPTELQNELEDEKELTEAGKILRRRDGNYCFSCNNCNKYFIDIQEIVDHMRNEELVRNAAADVRSTHTEFVDVSKSIDGEYVKSEVEVDEANDDSVYCNTPLDVQKEKSKKKEPNNSSVRKRKQSHKPPVDEDVKADLKCCWCSESFNEFGLVQNHLTDEHNKKPSDVYSCDHCQLFLKNSNLLSEHILSQHGAEVHKQFQKETDYEENTKPIQCVVCELWLNGTKAFDAHTKNVHKMYRILQCYICGIYKKKPSGLIEHLKVHDRFRKYRCYECDNVIPKITNPYDFRSHKCVLCGVWFLNHVTIRNHLTDVHGQDQIYDCTICDDFTFKTELELRMHGVNVHAMPLEYNCKICSKNCKSQQSLNEHMKSHSSAYNTNVCAVCGSKFRRKDYLMRHIKSHGDVNKDFTCYICKKGFQSNGYLKNHIKRHTEKKMQQCDICGRRFLLGGLLRKHMKEHEGEIWKCTQCPKEFSNKSKLTAHEKTHVTERNFRCDVCHKTYKTSKNLRQHKLVHSTERRIKCRMCNMTFNQGPEYELHLQTHNNDVTS